MHHHPRGADPQDVLTGTCRACQAVVEVQRQEARPPASTTDHTASGGSGLFADVPSVECPTCRARSKARPPQGTRVLLRTKPKPPCICGHVYPCHIHPDWPAGEEEPTSCLTPECDCKSYEAPLPGVEI